MNKREKKERSRSADPLSTKQALTSRRDLVALLKAAGKPQSLEMIAERLGHTDADSMNALRGRLSAMEKDGQIIQGRRGRYGLAQKMDLLPGRVIGHRDGFGFVATDVDGPDLYLSPKEMRKVFHGDRVLVATVNVDRRGRLEGSIVEVLERAHETVLGRYQDESDYGFVVPEDRRLNQDILISSPPESLADGDVVIVRLTRQPERKRRPRGEIEKVLGNELSADLEVEMVLEKYDIPAHWSDTIQARMDGLADSIDAGDCSGRVDLRELPLVTIDGADARDFDDAVYCEPAGDGWRLAVAIADVSHYVIPGTELDGEAFNRGTSVYFPDRVIPMLPEVLSNGLCSLRPEVDRLALVCWMEITAAGEIHQYHFERAVIHSHARLTYDQVAAFLSRGEVLPVIDGWQHRVQDNIRHLSALHAVLDEAKRRRGALAFESSEIEFEFAEDGTVAALRVRERNQAHTLIEECMVAANRCAAEFLDQRQIPALHRIHDKPDEEKITALRQMLGSLQLTLPGESVPEAGRLTELLESVAERPDAPMIQMMVLRSLKQAVYAPAVLGHFGMALEHYTHFTSPIRRYPDLLVHRAIVHGIGKKKGKRYFYSPEQMVDFGEHCSMVERRAEEATRDLAAAYKCRFISNHIGDEFGGVITGVTAFGVFVTLSDFLIDGLVHVSGLKNDYYHFDPVMQQLTAEHSGEVFCLGDAAVVKVVRASVEDRKIDFELVSH